MTRIAGTNRDRRTVRLGSFIHMQTTILRRLCNRPKDIFYGTVLVANMLERGRAMRIKGMYAWLFFLGLSYTVYDKNVLICPLTNV